jgi:uncharacterized glyoxalase superfamily protein PhnB
MSARFELFVSNVAASVAFYRDVLDFEELPSGYGYHPVRRGTAVIGIGAAADLAAAHYFLPEAASDARKGIGVEIVLEVDDIDTVFRKVCATGYPVTEQLETRSWGLRDFRLADPDGYYIRVTSRS